MIPRAYRGLRSGNLGRALGRASMACGVLARCSMLATVIGTIAATLTVTSFVPQAVRVIRTRNVKDLATSMWILSTTAFALWTIYGLFLRELPIVVPNAICFFPAGFILVMKVLPRPTRDAVADKLAPVTGGMS